MKILKECLSCHTATCGACGWSGKRATRFHARSCPKCGSEVLARLAGRHALGRLCRYAKATNESDSGREARDACAEGEGRMAVGNGGEGVSHEEGGAATGAGDPVDADGVAPTGAEGVAVVEQKAVCNSCWFAPGEDNGEHEICKATGCACATCEQGRREVAATPLPRWTVDSRTTDKATLLEAMAFRKPNGDTVAIMRNALCPTCGGAAVLFLADGDIVSYVRTRHGSCDMMPARA